MDLGRQEFLEDRIIGNDIKEVCEFLSELQIPFRVIVDGQQTLLTADVRYDRMNLHVDKDGKVYRMHAG